MLSAFRKLMEGPGKYVFMALIVAAFGVVGVPALSNFGRGDAVKVGNTGFTAQDVEQEFSQRYQRAQRDAETALTREEAIAQGLLDQTIGFLTMKGLVLEEADRLGLTVTDQMIQNFLRNEPAFQNPESGEFDSATFNRILQANGLSLSEFREQITFDLLRNQIDVAIGVTQPAPRTYADYLVLRQSEERDVTIAAISADDMADPAEDILRSYYEVNTDRYQTPEYRTFTLVALSPEKIRERVTIDEDDVRQLYDARVDMLGTPETRSFTQARFTDEAAAERALAAAQSGTPFTEAAEAEGATIISFTDDLKSAVADDVVADEIFATEEPGLVGPIDGLFGTFAAEVTAITPAVEVSFEEAREGLEEELFNEVFSQELYALYDEVQQAGDTGATLSEAATQVGLDAEDVGPVSASGMTINDTETDIDPRLLSAAFAMGESAYFEEIDLGDDGVFFVQVADIQPAEALPFEEVQAQVKADYLAEEKLAALESLGDNMRADLATGMSFGEAAAKRAAVASTRTIKATAMPQDLPADLADDIFTQPIGRVFTSIVPEDNVVLVARVDEIRFGPNAQAEMMSQVLRGQLGQELSSDIYSAYIAALEADAGVKTNQALLNQRFGTTQ